MWPQSYSCRVQVVFLFDIFSHLVEHWSQPGRHAFTQLSLFKKGTKLHEPLQLKSKIALNKTLDALFAFRLHQVTKTDKSLDFRAPKLYNAQLFFYCLSYTFYIMSSAYPKWYFPREKNWIGIGFHAIDPSPIMMCDSKQARWAGSRPLDETGIKYHGMLKTCLTGPKQGPEDYSALLGCGWINDFGQNNLKIEKKRKENSSLPKRSSDPTEEWDHT